MPYYDFECRDCKRMEEIRISDRRYTMPIECKKCGGLMRRIFSPSVIIQKGYKESDARFNRGKG